MRADVGAFVVGVQEEEQAREVLVFCVRSLADHLGEIGAPIQAGIGREVLPAAIFHVVDVGGQNGQLGGQVQAVFQISLPIISFPKRASLVKLGEHGFGLQAEDGRGKHGHGVGPGGQGLQQVEYVTGELAALLPFIFDGEGLFQSGQLVYQQQVIQPTRQRELGAGRFGQFFQQLGDGVPAQADAFHGVHVGDIAYLDLHTTDPAVNLLDGHVAYFECAVLAHQLLDPLSPGRELLCDALNQDRFPRIDRGGCLL